MLLFGPAPLQRDMGMLNIGATTSAIPPESQLLMGFHPANKLQCQESVCGIQVHAQRHVLDTCCVHWACTVLCSRRFVSVHFYHAAE
jgi:hypothetical protein